MKQVAHTILVSVAFILISCFPKLETREPSLEVKEMAPDFSLPNHKGEDITLDSLLSDGPAVVVFYRGHW
jgi:hypothetical protein